MFCAYALLLHDTHFVCIIILLHFTSLCLPSPLSSSLSPLSLFLYLPPSYLHLSLPFLSSFLLSLTPLSLSQSPTFLPPSLSLPFPSLPSPPSPPSPSLSLSLPSPSPSPSHRSALLSSILAEGTPFSHWDSSMIIAWLEVWVVVPFWYIAALRNCLQSGEMLAVSLCVCVCECECV